MNIGSAAKICFAKYAKFTGRASRSEYWYFVLFNFMVSIAISVFSGDQDAVNLYTLAIFIPSIAAGTRRLHDTGRSGWYQLICLIPLIGIFIVIFFFVLKGDKKKNRFGANPLGKSKKSKRSTARAVKNEDDHNTENDGTTQQKYEPSEPNAQSTKNSDSKQAAPSTISPKPAQPPKLSTKQVPTTAERTSSKSTPRFGRDAAKKDK